jgi:hypothetical protein
MLDAQKYQEIANSLQSRATAAGNPTDDQGPRIAMQYQSALDAYYPYAGQRQSHPDVPYTPVSNMAYGWQDTADAQHGRMIDMQQLALSGIRPSGSMARTVRGLGCPSCDAMSMMGLGATDTATTPLYKNPYVIAGGVGAVGLVAWMLLRKKRR